MRRDDDDLGVDTGDEARIRRIMAELDGQDHERHDPPASVWDGIEESLGSERARRPPTRVQPSPMVVEYRIDANDVLTDVGSGWAEFARGNDADELADPAADRTLWSFMDREEIRELWQLVVERVRRLQRGAHVPFRCDAPHARRWFEMAVTPETDGGVHFRSVLAFEEPRSPVVLLDPRVDRAVDVEPVQLCSWCGRGHHDEGWVDVEELVSAGRLLEQASPPPISFGICGPCRDEMAADVLVPAHTADPAP